VSHGSTGEPYHWWNGLKRRGLEANSELNLTVVLANHSAWAHQFAFMGTRLGATPTDIFTPPSEEEPAVATASTEQATQGRRASQRNLRGSST
jgi:hypothetical protein